MSYISWRKAVLWFLPLLLVACDSGGGGTGTSAPEVTPEEVETFFRDGDGAAYPTASIEGLMAMLDVLNGGQADGVDVIVNAWPIASGSVQIDVDGDGVRETTLTGGVTFTSLLRGLVEDWNSVDLEVQSIDGPDFLGGGGGTVNRMGSHSYWVEFTYEIEFDNGLCVAVTDAGYNADDAGLGYYLEGYEVFDINGLVFTVYFEPDGQGW